MINPLKYLFNPGTLTSKTFYAGAALVVYGIVKLAYQKDSTGVQEIILGLGMMAGRDAIEKLMPK
jgi:hypothetical protein